MIIIYFVYRFRIVIYVEFAFFFWFIYINKILCSFITMDLKKRPMYLELKGKIIEKYVEDVSS